jgi:ABC-type branched-subunit amino acid transport system ATPase component
MSDFLMSMKNVSLAFGGPSVLENVTLSVDRGLRAALTGNGVGFKAVAVLDVGAQNLLVGKNADRLHIVGIERERALVIKTRLGDLYAVQF